MDLTELKKLREENFLAHKKKKREYYLKNKLQKSQKTKETPKIYDYEDDLNEDNFDFKIREIIKSQKAHVDSRKDKIIAKMNEYKEKKQEYYKENRDKRLEYDKEYREEKKQELKEYRKQYYEANKDKILAKQKEKRNQNKEN